MSEYIVIKNNYSFNITVINHEYLCMELVIYLLNLALELTVTNATIVIVIIVNLVLTNVSLTLV